MDPSTLHERLPALVPAVLCPDPGDLAQVEAHVAAGCSRCARAVVNARDAAVSLAESAPPAQPRAELRERLLAAARGGALASRQVSSLEPRKPRRFFDAAGELARLHIGGPGDAERTREIDELGIATAPEGDACGRLLAQIQGLLAFPLLFVSVLRGDRCGYRVQIGMDGASRDRRRETTYCTHTVSMGGPMVVQDATREPFFRGSNMVLREGVKAYVGVPLRTSRGIVIGNVCAMDYVPRRIGPAMVRTLELYAEPIVAEIERARRRPEERWPRTAAGALLHPAGWFHDIVALAAGPLATAGPPSLIVAATEALADLAHPDEPVGRLDGSFGLLLPLLPPGTAAEARRAELQAALGAEIAVSLRKDFP